MKLNFFKKIFYPPNYLTLPSVGIEICNKTIKFVEFIDNNGNFILNKHGEVSLLPNTVKNGEILNSKNLEEALLKVRENISADFITVSIPEEKTYIFDVQLPKGASVNIREALEFKIEENVPLKREEIFFEYQVVEKKPNQDYIIVSVFVIPKKIIYQYDEIFKKVGLKPLSYEVESRMIANSVVHGEENKNSIIVDIKDNSTLIIGVVNGYVRVTTSISVGEENIKDNLFKAGISKEELSKSDFFEKNFAFENLNDGDTYLSLINFYSLLKDDVEKFSKYINDKFYGTKINQIVVCGRSSGLPGLLKHINQNLGMNISLVNVWPNIINTRQHSPKLEFSKSVNYAAPIGLFISSRK